MRQISRRNGKKNGYQLPEEDGHVRGKRLESDGLLAGEEAALGGRHGGEAEAEREAVQVLEKIWKKSWITNAQKWQKIVGYECTKMMVFNLFLFKFASHQTCCELAARIGLKF
jgi:hypothetical protein